MIANSCGGFSGIVHCPDHIALGSTRGVILKISVMASDAASAPGVQISSSPAHAARSSAPVVGTVVVVVGVEVGWFVAGDPVRPSASSSLDGGYNALSACGQADGTGDPVEEAGQCTSPHV